MDKYIFHIIECSSVLKIDIGFKENNTSQCNIKWENKENLKSYQYLCKI